MNQEPLMPWKDAQDAKTATLDLGSVSVSFPVTVEALAQEMRDQSDMKKPVRTAILRKSTKKLRDLHKKAEGLKDQAQEDYLFTAFIIWVDQQVGKDHLAIRDGKLDAQEKAQSLFESL